MHTFSPYKFIFRLILLGFGIWGGIFIIQHTTTTLPQERPADFHVELYESAGMRPISHTIAIASDSSSVKFDYSDAKQIINFTLAEDELDALWAVIYNNKFDRITSSEEEVYDRGGITIRIWYGDVFFSQSHSGMSFIDSSWSASFFAINEAIENIATTKIAPYQHSFQILLDEAFAQNVKYLTIDEIISLQPENGVYETSIVLLEGDHSLLITGPDSYNTYRSTFNSTGVSGLHLSLTDGAITLTPF